MSEAGQGSSSAAGYRVLARKYRPADFTTLIGQEPMVRTLTNAFDTGRVAQAWMLTGVRGVGKTTTARILARALNYKTAEIDRPSVALEALGEHCQAIMEGRHVDVIEMDAASHTGIDDIREIIEQVRYAPVSARYKVYIIDEVHMLSTQAFNGLLKTLEEPPPHVKFIFATTEIRKVPITVLSRTQRFDLRRVDAALLTGHLGSIAEKETITVEPEALAMIARAAEGSVRDSLSIFDQAIAHGSGTVTAEAVRAMLGLADRTRVIDLFEHIMQGDVAAALGELRAQYDTGADPATVLTDLAEFTHLVTRLRYVPEASEDASLSEAERMRGSALSQTLSVRVLSRAWQMLLKGITEVQTAARPVSAAEMVLIRLAHAAELPTLDDVLKGNGAAPSETRPSGNGGGRPSLPSGGNGGGGAASAVSTARMMPAGGGAQTMRLVQTEASPAPAMQTAVQPAPEPTVKVASLNDIVALAEAARDMPFKIGVKGCVRLVRIEPGKLEINLTEDAPRTLLTDIQNRLSKWTGMRWLVTVSREEGGQTLAEIETQKRESARMEAEADPTVAAILAAFPRSKIIDIRIPEAADDVELDLDNPVIDPGIDPGLDDPDEL
ncbi:DNA polymerase III subunit gamma/tau [Tianweitania sp. BSSL-BM11]|uniref:DNA polymerase III subunit gamma/tau n=1 Tax=Tianweitania aestuarii TaxID=2814886 RepID=A0ABS5RUE6_9HYPH|nr:DNA polymerase III subunit gamma/tau [Tianweitania aestuarii]